MSLNLKDLSANEVIQEEMKIRRMNAEARLINAQIRAELLKGKKQSNIMKSDLQSASENTYILKKYYKIKQLDSYIQEEKKRLLKMLGSSDGMSNLHDENKEGLDIGDRYLKKYYFGLLRENVLNMGLLPEPTWSDDFSVLLWWNKLLPMLERETIQELYTFFQVDEKDREVEQVMRKMIVEQYRRLGLK
ncbi:hypothetical protein [Paenibacillus senegalimassiliensis]|uniref:hypothetical protein n=1 Tax=Paenibacillus senegalimassiliensis TaxID=1737426 RepID=UPI00073E938D|nr:hypothetical protein [Paenibacillus senegalimassiliensis]